MNIQVVPRCWPCWGAGGAGYVLLDVWDTPTRFTGSRVQNRIRNNVARVLTGAVSYGSLLHIEGNRK